MTSQPKTKATPKTAISCRFKAGAFNTSASFKLFKQNVQMVLNQLKAQAAH